MNEAKSIISQAEAKANGLTRYYTGLPCRYGHIAERQTANQTCSVCAAEQHKKWKAKNPDKFKASVRKYEEANPEKVKKWEKAFVRSDASRKRQAERELERKEADPEGFRAVRAKRARLWRQKNLDRHRASYRKWYANNQQKVLKASALWRSKNKHVMAAHQSKRKAARIQATPRWANWEKIKSIYAEAARRGMTVDHVIPLRGKIVCGLHVETNLQLLTFVDNVRKSNKFNPDNF